MKKTYGKVITAACCLHNICITSNDDIEVANSFQPDNLCNRSIKVVLINYKIYNDVNYKNKHSTFSFRLIKLLILTYH